MNAPAAIPEHGYIGKKCLVVIFISQILTPMSTRSFDSVLPMVFKVLLGRPEYWVGLSSSMMVIFSLAGAASMPFLHSQLCVRSIYLVAFGIRWLSSFMYIYVLWSVNAPWVELLIYLTRVLHGLSLITITIPSAWLAVRLSHEEASYWAAMVTIATTFGAVVGPLAGTIVAAVIPVEGLLYTAPGWITIVSSTILIATTILLFDDDVMLSQSVKAEPDSAAQTVPRKAVLVTLTNSFCIGLAYLGGLESALSLVVHERFGYGIVDSWPIWALFVLSNTLGAGAAMWLTGRVQLAQLACLWWVLRLSGLLLVDLKVHPSLSQFLVSFFIFDVSIGMSMISHTTLLITKLPRIHQIKYQSMKQVMSQTGRSLGPVIVTGVMSISNYVSPGTGGNATMLVIWTITMCPLVVSVRWFNDAHVYGPFSSTMQSRRITTVV